MPWALHLAVDQGSVGKRPAFVRAAVLECVHAIGALRNCNTLCLRPDSRKHQLTLPKFSNIRDGSSAVNNGSLQYALRIRIPAIDADLVPIDKRSPEPSGDADAADSDE